jgi:hypothetical protein
MRRSSVFTAYLFFLYRVYVGYPRIAQDDVNKATLNVTELIFSDPTPSSIHINQTQVLGNKAIYHPTIFAFNATIALVGATGAAATLATVPIPQVGAEDGAIINVDTTLALNTSSDAVTNFTEAVLGKDTFELNFYGRPDLKEGPLPTNTVTFNKTVTMKGESSSCRSSIDHDLMLTLAIRTERPCGL